MSGQAEEQHVARLEPRLAKRAMPPAFVRMIAILVDLAFIL